MPVDLGDELRQQICDWLRANGVNPAHVPANPRVSLSGGQLTIECQARNSAGRAVIDPGAERPATEMRSFPVTVQPQGKVARWLGQGGG